MSAHLEIWEAENASLYAGGAWLAWLAELQERTGFTDAELDGDRAAGNPAPDPCCLDELVDWHREGLTPDEAHELILERIPLANQQAD